MKLSEIISQILIETGAGDKEYIKLFHIGRRGLRTIQKDLIPLIKREVWAVEEDYTITFPPNVTRVGKVGIIEGGIFKSYTKNSNLGATQVGRKNINDSNDYEVIEVSQGSPTVSLGVGSWTNVGEYNIVGRKIYLSPHNDIEQVVVEYSTLDETEVGDYFIEPIIEEAVHAYIMWQYSLTKKGISAQEKAMFKDNYVVEKRRAKLRRYSATRTEMNQSARQDVKLGLKS